MSRAGKQAALAGLLALALVSFVGVGNANADQIGVDCAGAGNPGPTMTIQIFNNSTDYDIFPLLLAGTASSRDEWMEACFQIPANQYPTDANGQPAPAKSTFYPRFGQYRLYINCCGGGEKGIAPGSAVQITLPLYSPLVQTLVQDPAKDRKPIEQFIDWWQGGNIIVYAVPTGSGYPDALASHWSEDKTALPDRTRNPTRNAPICGGVNGAGTSCALHAFLSAGGIEGWEPQQLLEYTLGAQPIDTDRTSPSAPLRLWNPENVDYDVSNVNNVLLPAGMLPFGNKLNGTCCAIGYVGTIATIDDTFAAIDSWRNSSLGMSWPRYVKPNTTPLQVTKRKVPSPLEIFTIVQDNLGNFNTAWNTTTRFSPAPSTSPQITRMKALIEACLGGQASQICGLINDVNALLQINFAKYKAVFADYHRGGSTTWKDEWGCTKDAVQTLTMPLFLAQLYGWNGFNALSGCRGDVNLLEQTPGYKPGDPGYIAGDPRHDYAAAKREFDQLHYWFNDFRKTGDYGQWGDNKLADFGQFNPYVPLIHGASPFMNAPYTYAYSVDDAFGNMQTDGTGLVILVGGPTSGQPVPDHVTREVQFSPGYRTTVLPNNPFAGLVLTMDKYTRCGGASSDFNPRHEKNPFTTFIVPQGEENTTPTAPPPNSALQCQIRMTDNVGRVYNVKLKDYPSQFPGFDDRLTSNARFVDCSGNATGSDSVDYCKAITVWRGIDPHDKHAPPVYHVDMPAPGNCINAGDKPLCAAACAKQGSTCTDK